MACSRVTFTFILPLYTPFKETITENEIWKSRFTNDIILYHILLLLVAPCFCYTFHEHLLKVDTNITQVYKNPNSLCTHDIGCFHSVNLLWMLMLLHSFLITSCIIIQNYFPILEVTRFRYIWPGETRSCRLEFRLQHVCQSYHTSLHSCSKRRYAVKFWFVTRITGK